SPWLTSLKLSLSFITNFGSSSLRVPSSTCSALPLVAYPPEPAPDPFLLTLVFLVALVDTSDPVEAFRLAVLSAFVTTLRSGRVTTVSSG
ncbi:hypothetical protein Tco_0479551, partial [Tanacetum coccineum]